jgi:hypothetical protein
MWCEGARCTPMHGRKAGGVWLNGLVSKHVLGPNTKAANRQVRWATAQNCTAGERKTVLQAKWPGVQTLPTQCLWGGVASTCAVLCNSTPAGAANQTV